MHSLCACGAQLVHLQPEKYFRPGTRPGRKWILLYSPLLRRTNGGKPPAPGRAVPKGICRRTENQGFFAASGEKRSITKEKGGCFGSLLRLSKIPHGAFRQVFAVCCVHNLSAHGEQIPHLQPDKYFRPGTRPSRKWILLYSPLRRRTLRGTFSAASF